MSATQNGPGTVRLCVVADHRLNTRLEYHQGSVDLVYDWTPDGNSVVWQTGYYSGPAPKLFYGDPDKFGDGAVQLTSGEYLVANGAGWYRSARFSPDGKTIAVAGTKIFFLSAPGQHSPMEGTTIAGVSDVSQLAWSPDGRVLVVAGSARNGSGPLSLVDIASGRITTLATDVTAVDWSRR